MTTSFQPKNEMAADTVYYDVNEVTQQPKFEEPLTESQGLPSGYFDIFYRFIISITIIFSDSTTYGTQTNSYLKRISLSRSTKQKMQISIEPKKGIVANTFYNDINEVTNGVTNGESSTKAKLSGYRFQKI